MHSILISTSSFGVESTAPLDKLRSRFQVDLNPHGRKLTPDETVVLLQHKQGVIAGTETYSREILKRLPKLRVISRCGAGTDGIDKDYLKEAGITLINTPDVHIVAVAELTLAGLLALNRKITGHHLQMQGGKWLKVMGSNLQGKNVGVIGFGKVGQQVAELLAAFGCRILIFDPYYNGSFPDKAVRVNSLDSIWSEADIITMHIPSSTQTKGMINSEILNKVKPEVKLINTSRGDLVDEDALYAFLKQHPAAGAYLDVFNQEPYTGPLAALPNIILTPHVGTFTRETRVNMEWESVNNLIKFFDNNE